MSTRGSSALQSENEELRRMLDAAQAQLARTTSSIGGGGNAKAKENEAPAANPGGRRGGKRGRDDSEATKAKRSKADAKAKGAAASAALVKVGYSAEQVEQLVQQLEKPDAAGGAAGGAAVGGSAKPDADEEEDSCCICLDGFGKKALFITECGHKFHFKCLKEYCVSGNIDAATCPLCRRDLPTPPAAVKQRECRHVQPAARRQLASTRRPGAGGARATNRERSSSTSRAPHPVGRVGETIPRIEEWKFNWATKVIKGTVYDYPGHEDGAPISTSQVHSAEGNVMRTNSGSRYKLGNIDTAFEGSIIPMGRRPVSDFVTEEEPLQGLLDIARDETQPVRDN